MRTTWEVIRDRRSLDLMSCRKTEEESLEVHHRFVTLISRSIVESSIAINDRR